MLNTLNKIKTDRVIIITVLLLCLYGLIAIYSATWTGEDGAWKGYFLRQLIWIIIGFVFLLVAAKIPLDWVRISAFGLYFVCLCFLILLLIIPNTGQPSRWINLGSIQLQPSEFFKPILVITLAALLSSRNYSPRRLRYLLAAFALVLAPFILVLKQPDLGTSLTFIIILIPMLYWKGLRLTVIMFILLPVLTFIASFNFWTFSFIMLIICAILILSRQRALVFWAVFLVNIIVGIVAPHFWNHLHDYQKQRVLSFLGLVSDPQGAGYQIIQSKVAIGSGGIIGKGFLQGSQTQLRFLPAQHTDFIFSVLAEEWGLLGALVVLVTFLVLLLHSLSIAYHAKSDFSGLMTTGFVVILAFQVIVNIGMTMGIMPVTGMPLPFISYGGSSLLTNMVMIGLILNTSLQRYK